MAQFDTMTDSALDVVPVYSHITTDTGSALVNHADNPFYGPK